MSSLSEDMNAVNIAGVIERFDANPEIFIATGKLFGASKLERKTSRGETPLLWCCKFNTIVNDEERKAVTPDQSERLNIMAITLINQGANINAIDTTSLTPLNWACYNGLSEVALLLIEKDAKIEAYNESNTPLIWAIDTYMPEVAISLINKGANIHVKLNKATEINDTPLTLSLADKRTAKVAELLIEKGADVNHVTRKGDRPLDLACNKIKDPYIIKMLTDKGATSSEPGIEECIRNAQTARNAQNAQNARNEQNARNARNYENRRVGTFPTEWQNAIRNAARVEFAPAPTSIRTTGVGAARVKFAPVPASTRAIGGKYRTRRRSKKARKSRKIRRHHR